MRDKRRLIILWLPVLVWMGVIFVISNQQGLPSPKSNVLDVLMKKTGHMFEYAVLGLLLLRAWAGTLSAPTMPTKAHQGRLPPAVLTVIVGSLYAISDEFHQLFIPTRKGRTGDVLIDILAVVLIVVLANWWQERRSRLRGQS